MIVNINTKRLNDPLNLNQIVFLTIWYYEDYREALERSCISKEDLTQLELSGYLTFDNLANHQLNRGKVSKDVFNLKLEDSLFKEFFETYPKYAINKKTGARRVLSPKSLSSKIAVEARKKYDKIVGKNLELHNHIIKLLADEVQKKLSSGDLIYMPAITVYINDRGWESWESIYEEPSDTSSDYGKEVRI